MKGDLKEVFEILDSAKPTQFTIAMLEAYLAIHLADWASENWNDEEKIIAVNAINSKIEQLKKELKD